MSWLDGADWSARTAEFGDLVEEIGTDRERYVAMELVSPGVEDASFVEPLWQLWLEMPQGRNMFHAVRRTRLQRLLVRYAAIDWKLGPVSIDDADGARRVATWGVELTRVFDFLSVCVPDGELGWFTCPFVKIDLQGMPRVGFVSPAGSAQLMKRVPPEVVARWPDADDASLVFAIGQLLLGLVEIGPQTAKTPLGQILLRSLSPEPHKRFVAVHTLREALIAAGGARETPQYVDRPQVWKHLEMGVGYASLGLVTRALHRFEWAALHAPDSKRALTGREEMLARGADADRAKIDRYDAQRRAMARLLAGIPDELPVWPPPTRSWADSEPYARELESCGRFAEAIIVYRSTVLSPDHAADVHTAVARCHLAARESGPAIDFARRALQTAPNKSDAHRVIVEALLLRKEWQAALEASESWLPVAAEVGIVHYTRAKIMLGLGNFACAREEVDLACELSPLHLPAMLLRCQIQRSIKHLRATSGLSLKVPHDLPPHLRDIRALLVAGHTKEALAILETTAHVRDTAAQLLRADLLMFSDRLDEALATFELAATLGPANDLAGLLGKAAVLVRLGRAEEALALCDVLVRDHANASEAHEGRAQALLALGRAHEAETALKRALAVGAQRSDVRVRLADR